MSNQRPGKKQSRPDMFGQEMAVLKFFKLAQKILLIMQIAILL